MRYIERRPHPMLAAHVKRIWVYEASADDDSSAEQRVVPDGYPEMVLHFGERSHEIMADGTAHRQSRFVFAGQISRPLLLRPGAQAGMIGIRLQPAGARAFLGIPMFETTDRRLDLNGVWGAESEELIDAVCNASGVTKKLQVVERFLLMKLAQRRGRSDSAVAYGVQLLNSADIHLSVDALAARCGLSSRQLERRFLGEVGIPPRLLASIFRFHRIFGHLTAPTPGRWVAAAIGAGYFDQAHMIRDFKRFAGQQPQAFYCSLSGLSAAMVRGDSAIN
jgi:AraC-like DNA-binding protein